MRKFKLKQGKTKVYDLTREIYIDKTMGDDRFHFCGKDGISRNIAVCPACDNPIQLVGLYKPLRNTEQPYGKHYNRDTEIAKHNETDYLFCPYASHKYSITRDSRKEELTNFERNIYNILRENADFAFYIIKQDTGIKFSPDQIRRILRYYKQKEGHMYCWATIYNIPWMLLYFSNAINCYGLLIQKDSELYDRLLKNRDVLLDEKLERYAIVGNSKGNYLNLFLAATRHKRNVVNDELEESIMLNFYKKMNKGPELFDVKFRMKLSINESRFLNLIHSEKAQKYRNPEILAIAQKVLPELP